MINNNLKRAIDSLMAYDKVTIKPFKDIADFEADIAPWEAKIPSKEEDNNYVANNSILGNLGYLIPPEDMTAEDTLIEYLKDIIDDISAVSLANMAILLSRISWAGGQDRDKEVFSIAGKEVAEESVNVLLEAYNRLPWPDRYKAGQRDNYRVKDWELMFRYFDYLPDFHDPMLPVLNLMGQAGVTPDIVKMPILMNKVALGFFYESWARYNQSTPFFRSEDTLIKAIEDDRLPPNLCTAYILNKARTYLDRLPKTIHWLLKKHWKDSGRMIMNYTYSDRRLPGETKSALSTLIDPDIESRFGVDSEGHKDTFNSFEWPYDYAALAGWVVDFENNTSKDLSAGAINEIASQWCAIREDLRANIKDQVFTSGGGRHRWFIDPLNQNAQKAMYMISNILINCDEPIWDEIIRGLKKDIALAKSLMITSTAQFHGLNIFEEWILILLYSILIDGNNNPERIGILTVSISESLLLYIMKAESDFGIWDYESRRPLLSKNLYLIIELVKKLSSNQYADKLKSEWKECSSTPWPWMVEEVV